MNVYLIQVVVATDFSVFSKLYHLSQILYQEISGPKKKFFRQGSVSNGFEVSYIFARLPGNGENLPKVTSYDV